MQDEKIQKLIESFFKFTIEMENWVRNTEEKMESDSKDYRRITDEIDAMKTKLTKLQSEKQNISKCTELHGELIERTHDVKEMIIKTSTRVSIFVSMGMSIFILLIGYVLKIK